MAGTGLPIPKAGTVTAQPQPVIDGDRYSSAQAWSRLAAAGAGIAATGEDLMRKELRQQQARRVADFEIEHTDWFVKARDRFNNDPAGFENAARAHMDGALQQVEPWLAAHAKRFLGGKVESGLSGILSETRARDQRLAAQSLDARRQSVDNEVMGLATAGKIGTPEWTAAIETFNGVLDSAVNTGLMPQDKADLLREDLTSRAQGENAARMATQVYREKGFEAASRFLQESVIENEKLSLKTGARQQIFNRGMAAVRLAQKEDAADRAGMVELGRDMRARIKSGQDVDPGEADEMLAGLRRTGAFAEHQRLARDIAVQRATAPYRTGAVPLAQFGEDVRAMRAGGSTATQSAYQFFLGKGYSPAQAAGIVGNLMHESGLKPDQSHDGGSGIGIAGWRLDRRAALQRFATERGKPVTDLQTQLEFVDYELRSSETTAMAALREAKTPSEAAAAFIHFERPAGYTPSGDLRGAHGYGNRVTLAEHVARAGDRKTGLPPIGEVTKQVQEMFVDRARKAWPDFEKMIAAGHLPSEEDFQAMQYAASLSGDASWMQSVKATVAAYKFNQVAGENKATGATKLAALDKIRTDLAAGGWTVDEERVMRSLEEMVQKQQRQATDDPVGFALDRGEKAPTALNLTSVAAARTAVAERVQIARRVSAGEGIPEGNPLRPAERQQIAAVIQGGKPEEIAIAMDALNSVSDTMFVPVMKSEEIKTAVVGAARGTDPGRFNAVMSALDRMYARAPEATVHLFGDDTVKTLQDWQAKLRYYTPTELAEQLRSRDDPQVRERMKKNVAEGEKIARERTVESLIGEWQSFMGFAGPAAPDDPRTRDAWIADYVKLFGERYAVSLDKDTAHRQAVERLKPYWYRSALNGGRLTLYAPEVVYQPDINGSHDWMRTELVDAIKAKTGREPSDYRVIADATTERTWSNGAPSYLIVVKNDATGEWDILRKADRTPHRFAWDAARIAVPGREEFARQQARYFEPGAPLGAMQVP
ncbi:MAG: hypothetical protein KJZ73_13015 [Pseudorhodoplanes sp.]|nr:hypothetical protein [Pseudorhodoplanes sp.]